MKVLGRIWLFIRGKAIFSCGHITSLRGRIQEGEHDLSWNLLWTPWKASQSVCAFCAIDASIDCCSCPEKIYPGDAVALYADTSKGRINWEKATRVGRSLVGCLRWKCCPSGGFFSGYWTAKGFQPLDFAASSS